MSCVDLEVEEEEQEEELHFFFFFFWDWDWGVDGEWLWWGVKCFSETDEKG